MGSTGTYGTAQNGGGTSILSTNGAFFYYGRLQVEALNVTNNLNYFAERIYAASNDIAFGESEYYDAHTGVILGDLGFESTVYGVSETGSHLWAFDATAGVLHHYTIGVSTEHRLIALEVRGPAGIGYYDSAPYEALALYDDGTSAIVTAACEWSIDRDLFGSMDANGVLTTLNRPGGITVSATYSEGGHSADGQRDVEVIHGYGESGIVEIGSFSLNVNVEQIEYSPVHGLLCLRQSESRILHRGCSREADHRHA